MKPRESRLKFVCRLGYGDALPADVVDSTSVPVFGSNGQYALTDHTNTLGPAIIVGRKGSYGKINWSPVPCFASDTTFYIDGSLTEHDLRWLYWTLQPLGIDEGSKEAAVPGLNREAVYEKTVLIPTFEGQRRIADYLDAETGRIDALVAEKERMLALLEEKRAALISRAVTRGLDPNAPLKPSGLDWLGDIPAHWTVARAKQLFRIRDERSQTGDEELLTVSHITGVTPRSEKDVYMFKAEDMTGYKTCQSGDLVVNTLWAWMGAMGVASQPGIVSPDYHVYEPIGDLKPTFVEILCRSKPFVAEVVSNSKGVWSSRLRLYPDAFLDMRLPVPPDEEQGAIVETLARERERSVEIEKTLRLSISLLKERRSALITAAVTGQIEPEAMRA